MGCIDLVRCVLVLRCCLAVVVWYPYAGFSLHTDVVFECYVTVATVCIYRLEHNYETTQLFLYLSLYTILVLFLLLILISLKILLCYFPLPLPLLPYSVSQTACFLKFPFFCLFPLTVSFWTPLNHYTIFHFRSSRGGSLVCVTELCTRTRARTHIHVLSLSLSLSLYIYINIYI